MIEPIKNTLTTSNSETSTQDTPISMDYRFIQLWALMIAFSVIKSFQKQVALDIYTSSLKTALL